METQAESNQESMEQQATIPEVATPTENVKACSQNIFIDLTIAELQKELAQAQEARENIEEETVPKKKYQQLQQQLKDIGASEAEAYDKC